MPFSSLFGAVLWHMETSLPCCVLPSEHLVKVLAGSTAIHWDSAPILAVCPCSKGICSALLGCTRQTTASCSTGGSLPLAQHFWSHAWRSLFSPGSSLQERCRCVGESGGKSQRWWREWGSSPMSKGWESWDSSACRGEGLGGFLFFNICRNQLPQGRVQWRWSWAVFGGVQRHN